MQSHLNLVFFRVEALREDVDVELFELSLQHELVVPDADVSQGMEGVRLDISRFVQHEEKHGLKHFQNGVGARLEIE